jgi:hypothetical protein
VKGIALVAVQAGRDEHIDLPGDHREGDESRTEHRKLELHDEIFKEPGIDELGIFRTRHPHIGPGQHVVDLLGEEETDHGRKRERGDRLDQPAAQLDQVIHQRRLGRLDGLLFVLAAHSPGPAV